MSKRLLVLRHGHAERQPPIGGRDFDRPLRAKGRAAVDALSALVRQVDPDLVLCSPAVRTRETLHRLELAVPADFPEPLYGADADELIEAIREVDAEHPVECLLLIGHNPGVHQLVLELTGGEAVPGFPPAALAALELDVDDWWEVGPASGRLIRLHLPADPAE